MKRKHKRLAFVAVGLALLGAATALVMTALRENIVFFYSPSDIQAKMPASERRIRMGGLVEQGSVLREGKTIRFRVTDTAVALPVVYTGILPDLFREGQGVVAEGRWQGETFQADSVLAKHDETYMPPEVADAIKRSGQWKGEDAKGGTQPAYVPEKK